MKWNLSRHIGMPALCCILIISVSISTGFAGEGAKSVYLMGKAGPTAGLMPGPGLYIKDDVYFYSGSTDELIPSSGRLVQELDATALINLTTITWVPGTKIGGGTLGLGLLIPYGYQNIEADFELTGPQGNVFSRDLGDSVTSFGDPIVNAALGWHDGCSHWNIYTAVWIPAGDYKKGRLTNMGTNHWAGELGAGYTWLNPKSGLEISGTAGITFNGENPDTDYQTGREIHFEGALIQHLPNKIAFGLAGYLYQQLTGDSGDGAVLGSFKGRTMGIGPTLAYTFKNNMALNVRWYHEFSVENRVKGDAFFATLTIPFAQK